MEERSEEASQLATRESEFNALVAPLEVRSRQRLNGPGRPICFRAFLENPEGCRGCAERALARGVDPLALFVKMCRDGDWDLPDVAEDELLPRVRRTGWREVRGSHGLSYVRDPEGTDPAPRYAA